MRSQKKISFWFMLAAVIGPGLVVMLADTDAGSIITAAQSGATLGYKLLLLQFLMIPILFIAQELTVRLGVVTGRGHGELIKHQFGTAWAWLSVSTLVVCCAGAIITELSGLAGVGSLWGVDPRVTVAGAVLFLVMLAWTGSYKSVERIAIFIGLFELAFLFVAWDAKMASHHVTRGLMPTFDGPSLYLMAANIGAVIMPWMIFYQQSAVIDKGLKPEHLKFARWDTAIGAIITQVVMASVLVAAANVSSSPYEINKVQDISLALKPLGHTASMVLFSLGMMGASLVAAIVVSLTAAWGLGELLGYRRSLQDHPKEAPWFYGVYTLVLVLGGVLVASGANLVKLSIGVEVMNALLLPIVLGFLFLLARKALPESYRLKGLYAFFVGVVLFLTASFGVVGGVFGIFS